MLKLLKNLNKKDWLYALICAILVVVQVWLELKMPDYMSEVTQLVQTKGAAMTDAAFAAAFPGFGSMLLMVGLVLFAFTTILGWNYYGERCVEYLLGVKAIMPYRIIFIILIACGPFLKLEEIWVLADIVNGLMAIPNLIALLALTGVVVAETKAYEKHLQEMDK